MSNNQRVTVLIVDDTTPNRKRLRSILKRGPFGVIGEAADTEEALQLYTELQPDLVLMGTVMPSMDGIEATRAIVRRDPGAQVIMCSMLDQQRKLFKHILATKVEEAVRKVWA